MTDKLSRLIAFIDGGGLSRRGFLQTGAATVVVASTLGKGARAAAAKQGQRLTKEDAVAQALRNTYGHLRASSD